MVQTILSDFSVTQHIQAEQECKNTKNSRNLREFGAGNGARTRHLRLGKAALYQMSYSRILKSTLKWCGRRDSNSYTLRHRNLNPARLPIPPRPLMPSAMQCLI